MLTPEEIQSREFLVSLRGYDRDEVHAFLDRVAEQIRDLQARVREVDAGTTAAAAPEAGAPTGDPSGMFEQIGQETNRILEAAHQAGAAIKRTARQEADKELQSARGEAARMIAEGERRRDEVQALIDELEQTKQQLADDLRSVGRSIEGSMRQLLGEDAATSSVREALAAEALPDDAEPPGDDETAELPVAPGPEDAGPEDAGQEDAGQEDAGQEGTGVEGADEPPAEPGPEAARTAALAPLNVRLVRQIKRGLHDVQNLVLDRLRRHDGQGPLEEFLPTDDELEAFSGGVAETLDEAYVEGQRAAAEQAGRELPAPSEQRSLVDGFLSDAADRIRGGLAANLRMGLEVDEDVATLSSRVSAVFGEIKQATTDEWAETHLVRCYELGQLDAWAAGGITHREWVVGVEPRCPEGRCRQNGQAAVLPLGERYPSGHETPPVHAGCTCTTVPVLEAAPDQPETDRS